MKADLQRRQEENAQLKQRLVKITDLEDHVTELNRAKSTLSDQVSSLSTELEASKQEENKVKTQVEGLLKKLEGLDKEFDQLEAENNDLLSKQKEGRNAIQTCELLKNENAKLKTDIDELKASKNISFAVGGSPSSETEEVVRAREEKIEELEKSILEWTDLAKVSSQAMRSCKTMILTYNTALLQGVQGDAPNLQEGRPVPPGSC
jgi:chromosome segregation ATPase